FKLRLINAPYKLSLYYMQLHIKLVLLNEEFDNGNADTKTDTLKLIGATKNAAAIPILIRALSESDWIVRSEAVSQIRLLGIWLDSDVLEDGVTALIHMLQSDPENSVRSSAAISLGGMGHIRAVPVLIEALSKDNLVVRSSAAYALGRLQDRSAISELIRSLQDEDYVCEAAIRSLRILDAVESLPALRKLLQRKAIKVRGEVIFSLGFLRNSKDLPNLQKALKDKEFSIRLYAAYSLSELNNRKGIPILEEALKNGNKDTRKLALGGLKNFHGKVGLSSIVSTAFTDDEYSIRKEAVDFLEAFKESQEIVNELKKALNNLNEDICRNAMDAAKTIGNAEILSRLRQLAEIITVVERPLEAIAAIQSRGSFYNYEIYQQAQEADNLGLEDDLIRNLYKDIDKVISQIQENPELRQNDKEDRLTIDIVNQLRILGYDVSHETKIGGHVDIVVRKNDLLWLGEAKIYSGNNNLWQGFEQLVTRYSTGDSNQENGGLLIYILRHEDASSIMQKWQNYLLQQSLPDFSFRPCTMRSLAFISTHKHERSGQAFHVRHIPVMLHFDPKDKSGRARKTSP
ncbi:HEAT repeat domain-containing protein, partial [Microcoleus sp. Pol11C2]|uniref:HEAT repeat domain-containing protein n=1 Tax=Microcoleus sp. Pol11C2 TaxID=3055389 RepID=UPI002FD01EC8